MGESVKVRVLLAKPDPNISLYYPYVKGHDILKITDVSKIKRSEVGNLISYQRKEAKRHIDLIADYLNGDNSILIPEIILALSVEVSFKQSWGLKVGN